MNSKWRLLWFVGALVPVCAWTHGGDEILARNPQLSKIPDWPKRSSNTGSVSVPIDCNKCALGSSLDNMRRAGDTPYRCVNYEGQWGGNAWESGSGNYGRFELQLHPNSPIVWRVFLGGGYSGDASSKLIAEFDPSGRMIFSKSARSPIPPQSRSQDSSSTDCPRGRPYHPVSGPAGALGTPPVHPGEAAPQRGNQTDNSVPSSPIVNPNPNPVDDVIKKGVGDLLRKLGQ